MNILHVIPSFYPAQAYGGAVESAYQLCSYLANHDCQLRVLTTDANGRRDLLHVENEREVELGKFRVRYCHRAMCDAASPQFLRLLPSYLRWSDIVHLTAVYSFTTIPTLLCCRALNKPVVWSPRGSLSRWKGSRRLLLKVLWEWMCLMAVPPRLVLHVTSKEEAEDCRKRFLRMQSVIIPNGVVIPDKVNHVFDQTILRLLYLGRLDPKKGIENLLDAIKMWKEKSSIPCSLTIAGSGTPKYVASIRARANKLRLSNQINMIGHVVGEDKQKVFENTDIVLVPSYTENFGMVIAEALAHGLPVIASKGTPWQRLEEMGCGLWVDNYPESLAEAICRLHRSSPLHEMGQRGREWMTREFSWHERARTMLQCYSHLAASQQ